MRIIRTWWRRIPRPARIVSNLLLAAVLLGLFYVFRGCPDLNAEQAYRREAARNLVGSGEILGVIPVDEELGYDRLLAAETQEGVILYCYRESSMGLFGGRYSSIEGTLTYREKAESIAIMAAPAANLSLLEEKTEVPVILFDDHPRAVRAELDLTLIAEHYGGGTYSYSMEARREQSGLFVFGIAAEGEEAEEKAALYTLCQMYRDNGGFGDTAYPAAVRLYDQQDELLYEQALTLRSAAGEAHARREAGGEG